MLPPISASITSEPVPIVEEWKPVFEWKLAPNKTVHLIRSGDRLASELIIDRSITRQLLENGDLASLSTEQKIEIYKKFQPYIKEDGSVEFLVKRCVKSSLNDDVTIDERDWGVTLVDLLTSSQPRGSLE